MTLPRQVSGFTLIELLIVVAVFVILASVAIPSYTQHVLKGNRIDGKEMLLAAAVAQERFSYNSLGAGYTNDPANLGFAGGVSDEGHYALVVNLNANGYTLTANAIPPQDNDSGCAMFSLTHTGFKDSTSGADCW